MIHNGISKSLGYARKLREQPDWGRVQINFGWRCCRHRELQSGLNRRSTKKSNLPPRRFCRAIGDGRFRRVTKAVSMRH
jgi:hypothetical protein